MPLYWADKKDYGLFSLGRKAPEKNVEVGVKESKKRKSKRSKKTNKRLLRRLTDIQDDSNKPDGEICRLIRRSTLAHDQAKQTRIKKSPSRQKRNTAKSREASRKSFLEDVLRCRLNGTKLPETPLYDRYWLDPEIRRSGGLNAWAKGQQSYSERVARIRSQLNRIKRSS